MKHFTIIFIILIAFIACKTKKPASSKAIDEKVFNTWVHEGEKDSDSTRQYRPSNYELPPSRGRQGFTIEKNGNFILKDIAPACGLESFDGKWIQEQNGNIKVNFPKKVEKNFKFEIVRIEIDLLIIKIKN